MARGQSEEDYPGLITFARDIGLDMIDIFMMSEMQTPEFLLRTKLMCVEAGLPIGYFASGVSLVGSEDMRGQRLARAKADADSAAFIGAQVLHVFARHAWPDTVEEQERFWGPMIEDFQELADYCAERGVVVSLQNHNHGSFAMNANQVLRILREVGRKNFTYISTQDSGRALVADLLAAGITPSWTSTRPITSEWHPMPPAFAPRYTRSTTASRSGSTTRASSVSSATSISTAPYQSCLKVATYPATGTTTDVHRHGGGLPAEGHRRLHGLRALADVGLTDETVTAAKSVFTKVLFGNAYVRPEPVEGRFMVRQAHHERFSRTSQTPAKSSQVPKIPLATSVGSPASTLSTMTDASPCPGRGSRPFV